MNSAVLLTRITLSLLHLNQNSLLILPECKLDIIDSLELEIRFLLLSGKRCCARYRSLVLENAGALLHRCRHRQPFLAWYESRAFYGY